MGNMTSYQNQYSPFGVQMNNPGTRFTSKDVGAGIDLTDESFAKVFNSVDIDDQREMLQAMSNQHALKILERRNIFKQSSEANSQDSIPTQLFMGGAASLLSPTTILPMGAAYKYAQIGSKANKIIMSTIAGSGTALAANMADEAMIDAQGMPTNYGGVALASIAIGGGLGFLGGVLSGPNAVVMAKNIHKEGDFISKDFAQDNYVLVDQGTETLLIPKQMEKGLVDKIPYLGDWLSSDITKLYQSDSSVLRGVATRIANATVAQKDANGNFIAIGETGMDFKTKMRGVYNTQIVQGITEIFNDYKKQGGTLSREDFNTQVHKMYTSESNRLSREAHRYADEQSEEALTKLKEKYKAEKDLIKTDEAWYKGPSGKLEPYTPEVASADGIKPDITIKKRPKQVVQDELTKLEEKYNADVAKIKESKLDEYYTNNKPSFKNADANTIRAIEQYQKYYDTMLETSQKLGVKEVQGIKGGRLYSPRTWDFQKIRAYDEGTVKARLREALLADTRNNFNSEAELSEYINELYAIFKSKDIESRLGQGIGYLAKQLPFTTKLKSRKIYIDDSKLGDLVSNNMEEVAGQYHYFNSGIQSVYKAFGTDDLTEIVTALEKESAAKGEFISNTDLKALRNSIEDLLGTLRVNQFSNEKAWQLSRNLMTFNSARLMGGAGGNQIIEMATVTAMNLIKGNFILKHTKAWNNAASYLYKEKAPEDGFSRFLVNSGYMETALHTHRVNKVGDVEAGFKESWLEKGLHAVNDFQMKYNGMRYFTAVLEDMTGGAVMDYLIKGNASAEQLARWGLTKEDAADLQKVLKGMSTKKGNTYTMDNFDLSKMSDVQRDKFQLAISRGISEFVIQADSIHAPTWFKTAGPMLKVLTQFMRFPLIAQEVLLRRGFREDKAAMVAGLVGSSMVFMGMKYLREEAAIAMGLQSEYDRKYDYSDSKQLESALYQSLNYAANLGILTTLWNYGATGIGKPELGREWSNNSPTAFLGPTSSLLFDDVWSIAKAGAEGDFTSQEQYNRYKHLMPLLSLPVLSEGINHITRELGE